MKIHNINKMNDMNDTNDINKINNINKISINKRERERENRLTIRIIISFLVFIFVFNNISLSSISASASDTSPSSGQTDVYTLSGFIGQGGNERPRWRFYPDDPNLPNSVGIIRISGGIIESNTPHISHQALNRYTFTPDGIQWHSSWLGLERENTDIAHLLREIHFEDKIELRFFPYNNTNGILQELFFLANINLDRIEGIENLIFTGIDNNISSFILSFNSLFGNIINNVFPNHRPITIPGLANLDIPNPPTNFNYNVFGSGIIMRDMFSRTNITNLNDISNWDVSNVSDFRDMFREATLPGEFTLNWNLRNSPVIIASDRMGTMPMANMFSNARIQNLTFGPNFRSFSANSLPNNLRFVNITDPSDTRVLTSAEVWQLLSDPNRPPHSWRTATYDINQASLLISGIDYTARPLHPSEFAFHPLRGTYDSGGEVALSAAFPGYSHDSLFFGNHDAEDIIENGLTVNQKWSLVFLNTSHNNPNSTSGLQLQLGNFTYQPPTPEPTPENPNPTAPPYIILFNDDRPGQQNNPNTNATINLSGIVQRHFGAGNQGMENIVGTQFWTLPPLVAGGAPIALPSFQRGNHSSFFQAARFILISNSTLTIPQESTASLEALIPSLPQGTISVRADLIWITSNTP
jgi:hypothetical protein